MSIYLAARFSRRAELRGYAHQLEVAGVGEVRARWLVEDHEWDGAEDQLALAERLAADDLADLRTADLVVVFTEVPSPGGRNRGGRHVEYGVALELWRRGECRLVVVGPAENVFHSHAPRFTSFADVLRQLVAELDPSERHHPANAERWLEVPA